MNTFSGFYCSYDIVNFYSRRGRGNIVIFQFRYVCCLDMANNSAGDGKSCEIEEKSLLKCYIVILNSFLSFILVGNTYAMVNFYWL